MNRLSDIQINCAVRRVLVRHWIDLGKISIRTTSGVSYLSGTLTKLPQITPALEGKHIAEIMAEIGRVRSIRRIQPSFTNWCQVLDGWKRVEEKAPAPLLMKRLPDGPITLDLTELERELESEGQAG